MQQRRQIAHHQIGQRPSGAVDEKESSSIAIGRRVLRDQLGRQVVIEIGNSKRGIDRRHDQSKRFGCCSAAPTSNSSVGGGSISRCS